MPCLILADAAILVMHRMIWKTIFLVITALGAVVHPEPAQSPGRVLAFHCMILMIFSYPLLTGTDGEGRVLIRCRAEYRLISRPQRLPRVVVKP